MTISQEDSIYEINENGVNYRHGTKHKPCQSGEEFLSNLRSNFRMRILEQPNPYELVFEMINIDVSFANALRRIMIAEVPTMAIEHIYMWNNSSIIPDEVLSHRIGLIPLKIDPRYFSKFDTILPTIEGAEPVEEAPHDRNTCVLKLKVSCPKTAPPKPRAEKINPASTTNDSVMNNEVADKAAESTAANYRLEQQNKQARQTGASSAKPIKRPHQKNVYSGDLEWIPQGDQENRLPFVVKPIHDDILIAKLRPGQLIELEAHARVSNGKDHAKFSPVATATYRLMPHVELIHPVYDELADELIRYEPGVFKIVPCNEGGHMKKAVIDNPYACTMSRNYMRNEKLKKSVKISRIENHFIFSIEAVGMLPASVVLAESIKILREKSESLLNIVQDHEESRGMGV